MRVRPAAIARMASIAVALTMVGAPMARADDDSFVRSAKALGFVQTSTNLISIAEGTCYLLRLNNRIPSELEERVQRETRVKPDQAHQFFMMAVNEYCPEYNGVVGA